MSTNQRCDYIQLFLKPRPLSSEENLQNLRFILDKQQTKNIRMQIPYRDSYFTLLLQGYFEKGSMVSFIVNLNSAVENFDENMAALDTASIAKKKKFMRQMPARKKISKAVAAALAESPADQPQQQQQLQPEVTTLIKVICPICIRPFTNRSRFDTHHLKFHTEVSTAKGSLLSKPAKLVCHLCGKLFANARTLATRAWTRPSEYSSSEGKTFKLTNMSFSA